MPRIFATARSTLKKLVSPFKVSFYYTNILHCLICVQNNVSLYLVSCILYLVSHSIVADDILDVTATSEELGKTAGKDEAVDKTTYVKLLGLEKSKSEALRLVAEAKQALAKYGDKALPLIGIADYIVERKN